MTRRTRSWSWDNKTKTLAIDGKTERDLTSSDNVVSTVGAATGSPPQVSAVGDDTNIDLRLVAKGDGNIEVRNNLEILTNKRIVDSAGTNVEFGDDIHMNSNKVTNLGTPSASTDAATKGYVDTYSLLLASGGTIAADLTVTGNLTVSGTTTTINTATLSVADNIVNLNSDFTSGTPSENAGLQVIRGDSSNVQIRWNETSDSWEATRDGSTYVKIPNQALDTTDSPTFSTVTYTTLNDGSNSITATAAEINVLDGITATVSELNILDGVTATASELNILDGVTATATELNYVDGVTSNIQTQIDNISSSFTLSDNQGTPNTDTFTTGQTLTFAGSTGIDTTVSDNQVAIAIDSTVATLTGTQTLTNKTINSASNTITITESNISDLGSYITASSTDTLTNKTINSASNTITITESNISDLGSYITASSTDTLTNKTLTTPVISSISNTGTLTLPTSTGTVALTSDITLSTLSVTATASELNILDGVTATTAELNYVDGVTSNVQTQLDAKAPLASPALTGTATAVNLTLSGDLTVNGTTTTVATTNMVVSDNLIELNNGASSNANDSGIVIERGSTGDNAIIAWDESADAFVMGTTTATGASTGDLTITAGALSIGSLTLSGTAVTSTAAELNILDGVTATTTELNYVDGVTSNIQTQIDGKLPLTGGTVSGATTFQNTVNITGGSAVLQIGGVSVTSTAAELNILDGVTATASELNILDGVTSTATELNLLDGVTGTLVTEAGTQTLTNKTLTTPVISSISNTGTLTLPTSTDTLVGRATTDTLTNKTLTSPTVGTNLDLSARAPVQFYDTDSSNYIGLRAPSTVASNYTFTLPAQDGTSQQVIVTDGAGNWSFANQSGGGGASGFQSSTLSTHPAASTDEDLATGPSDDTAETPFESTGTDAFGVSLGAVYDQMEPVGSTSTTDLGDSEAYVGA